MLVKKVITNLDLSKASGPDCEPELSNILAELFNMCLKESCFPDCLRSHLWSQYLRMLGKGVQLKTIALLVFFLLLVKSLKNL